MCVGTEETRGAVFGQESRVPVNRQAAQRSGPTPGLLVSPSVTATGARGRPCWEWPGSDLDAAPALVLQEVHGRQDAGLEGEAQEEVQLRGVQLLLHGQDLRAWVVSPGSVTGRRATVGAHSPRRFGLGQTVVICHLGLIFTRGQIHIT